VSEAEYIEMAENIDLKIPSSSSHNGNGGGSGSSHGNSHRGNCNNGIIGMVMTIVIEDIGLVIKALGNPKAL